MLITFHFKIKYNSDKYKIYKIMDLKSGLVPNEKDILDDIYINKEILNYDPMTVFFLKDEFLNDKRFVFKIASPICDCKNWFLAHISTYNDKEPIHFGYNLKILNGVESSGKQLVIIHSSMIKCAMACNTFKNDYSDYKMKLYDKYLNNYCNFIKTKFDIKLCLVNKTTFYSDYDNYVYNWRR